MLRQTFEKDVPQTFDMDVPLSNSTLDPGEDVINHWWVSHHTAKQRYIFMTKEGVRRARTPGTAPRISSADIARRHIYVSSVAIAKCMNDSQRDYIKFILASVWKAKAMRARNESLDDSDSEKELE
jgi:hypothetical protein